MASSSSESEVAMNSETEAHNKLAEGRQLLQTGDIESALSRFDEVVALNANSMTLASAYMNRLSALRKLGRHEQVADDEARWESVRQAALHRRATPDSEIGDEPRQSTPQSSTSANEQKGHHPSKSAIRYHDYSGQQTRQHVGTVADKILADYTLFTWPTGLRIVLGGVAVWSAIEVGFLGAAYSGSAPSSTAELMSTHNDVQYRISMAFHSLAILLFAAGALLPRRMLVGVSSRIAIDDDVIPGQWLLHGLYFLFALGLFIVFLVSTFQARYQVFVDLSKESIVRRDTHLLPPGVTYQRIRFNEIDILHGEAFEHDHRRNGGSIEYHTVLSVVTTDGQEFEIGRDFPAQSSSKLAYRAESLAHAIADKSGVRLDLR